MQNIVMETLARYAFAESALSNARLLGARQYVDFNSPLIPDVKDVREGMRHSRVFLSVKNRISQLEIPRFAKGELCFCNMLGLSYVTPLLQVQGMLSALTRIFPEGSSVILDRPEAEPFDKLEKMAENCGFLLYEHQSSTEINESYLKRYNSAEMTFSPLNNINFFLLVKKSSKKPDVEINGKI